VPAPRFLLRRAVILESLIRLPRGRLLEIGSGAGSLLADLHKAGFTCEAVETSEEARALSAKLLADLSKIVVHPELPKGEDGKFDLLFSFEVLEHIADDAAALRDWMRLLRPGGRVLLSVPAHAKKWTATDIWAGHVRRYDRADFVRLAESAGIRVERCDNYGFPLANIIEPINAWAHRRELAKRAATVTAVAAPGGDPLAAPDAAAPVGDAPASAATARDQRSAESGVRRSMETRLYPLITSLPGRLAMRAAIRAQRWFVDSELGNGFLLEGVKR
jgi:SAM-dependent methyltransferase